MRGQYCNELYLISHHVDPENQPADGRPADAAGAAQNGTGAPNPGEAGARPPPPFGGAGASFGLFMPRAGSGQFPQFQFPVPPMPYIPMGKTA